MEFEPKPVPGAIIAPEPGSAVKNVVDSVVNSSFPERRGHDRQAIPGIEGIDRSWVDLHQESMDVEPGIEHVEKPEAERGPWYKQFGGATPNGSISDETWEYHKEIMRGVE